jgi:hypothetical protein
MHDKEQGCAEKAGSWPSLEAAICVAADRRGGRTGGLLHGRIAHCDDTIPNRQRQWHQQRHVADALKHLFISVYTRNKQAAVGNFVVTASSFLPASSAARESTSLRL